MASNIDQTTCNNILDASVGGTAYQAVTPIKCKLMGTVGSNTSDGTELANGNGYTTGGLTITFNTSGASAGSLSGPSAAITWTASGGSLGPINGAELWDSAGTPVRHWQGAINGAPITVASGNSFQIAINGIQLGLT